jgi:steroid delta-isomerase-like uncharacterized protein
MRWRENEMSVVDGLVTAISAEDTAEFGALYADDAILHEPLYPEPVIGRQAIVEGEAGLFRAFADITIEVRSEVAAGTQVVAELILAATNDGPLNLGEDEIAPTGKRIEIPIVWVLELNDDGLIADESDYFDTSLIMHQLGLE